MRLLVSGQLPQQVVPQAPDALTHEIGGSGHDDDAIGLRVGAERSDDLIPEPLLVAVGGVHPLDRLVGGDQRGCQVVGRTAGALGILSGHREEARSSLVEMQELRGDVIPDRAHAPRVRPSEVMRPWL